jgi:two-component system sensor histidine kinase KdpD
VLPSRFVPYAYSFLSVALGTGVCWLLYPGVDQANLIMVYLLGIIALSYRQGAGPSVLASFLSMLAFDFFFVPPRFTFAVADIHYLFMFFVMLLVGLFISHLAVRVRHQAERTREAQVLIETERLRSSLLSSVSHDLRTPLAAITGSASSLLSEGTGLDPSVRKDLLENIRDEAERLERLVANLLEMTQLEAGSVPLRREMHHMGEIIGSAIARLEKRIGNHPLSTQVPTDLPLVPMDALLMEQVVINLLENALKYAPDGTPIQVSAWVEKGWMGLRVADQGPGIPPEDLDRLFEKFYQGAQKGRKGGAGLGLAISRGIVQIHGGSIRAMNRAEGGAAFEIRLPLRPEGQEVGS